MSGSVDGQRTRTEYPNGLKGEAAPLAARIVMLADQYDAMRAQHTYSLSASK